MKHTSTEFISAQTNNVIILIFLPFALTTLLSLLMCYYLASVWDLVTIVFTNTLLVHPCCLRYGHYFRSMVPGYGFQLSLFTISVLWWAIFFAISFQVHGNNSRSSNYMQYQCYCWQHKSVQGINVALSVNQTYMVSMYIYIYIYISQRVRRQTKWMLG